MATNYTEGELAHWCVCGKAHASFCVEEPCYFGATWPHPHMPLQSMEDIPWMTEPQARRAEVYRAQRAGIYSLR